MTTETTKTKCARNFRHMPVCGILTHPCTGGMMCRGDCEPITETTDRAPTLREACKNAERALEFHMMGPDAGYSTSAALKDCRTALAADERKCGACGLLYHVSTGTAGRCPRTPCEVGEQVNQINAGLLAACNLGYQALTDRNGAVEDAEAIEALGTAVTRAWKSGAA